MDLLWIRSRRPLLPTRPRRSIFLRVGGLVGFIAQAALAEDPTWRARITAASVRRAVEIASAILDMESPTAVDKARLILARSILAYPESGATLFALPVALRPGIDGNSTDDELIFWVDEYWNIVANVPI